MFDKCKELLIKEHEAVLRSAAHQELMQEAVFNRDWTEFQVHQEALTASSDELAALEREREALFPAVFAGSDHARFYSLCAHFSPEQRNEVTSIYRSLKLEALRLRVANEQFMEYLNGIKTTLADFMELAFPDRGGKIYTPHGTPVSHDMRSMVLNQQM